MSKVGSVMSKTGSVMGKSGSKANVLNVDNNNILTIAIAVVVLAIVLMFFWDRQQQRAVELRRIETKIDLLEEWGIRPQQQLQQQNAQQNNINAQVNGGRIF
jgi:HAMP domain-containing protein